MIKRAPAWAMWFAYITNPGENDGSSSDATASNSKGNGASRRAACRPPRFAASARPPARLTPTARAMSSCVSAPRRPARSRRGAPPVPRRDVGRRARGGRGQLEPILCRGRGCVLLNLGKANFVLERAQGESEGGARPSFGRSDCSTRRPATTRAPWLADLCQASATSRPSKCTNGMTVLTSNGGSGAAFRGLGHGSTAP
jgi:hypothetical protein